jgi:hypothetical protein
LPVTSQKQKNVSRRFLQLPGSTWHAPLPRPKGWRASLRKEISESETFSSFRARFDNTGYTSWMPFALGAASGEARKTNAKILLST